MKKKWLLLGLALFVSVALLNADDNNESTFGDVTNYAESENENTKEKQVTENVVDNNTSSLSQTFCTEPGNERFAGDEDGYRYELWNQNGQGTACMTIYEGAAFSGEWDGILNYLARRGLGYNKTKEHQEIGSFTTEYNCEYNPSSASGNSYLSVYGWTVDPLIEYYIVEDWRNWIPSMADGATKRGTIEVDGSIYDIIENTRVNQPSIVGTATFQQYFSIRRDVRNSGTINVTDHFKKWESLGLDMGKMYEVSFVVEGYQSSGNFDFKELKIDVGEYPVSEEDRSENSTPFKIYPIPSSGTVTIELENMVNDAHMKVFNASGKLVCSETTGNSILRVEKLNKGVYFVRITAENNTYNSKFVVL